MAENYHNIWAKKKKSDLGSKGDFLMESKTHFAYRYRQNREGGTVCDVGGCQEPLGFRGVDMCL